MNCLHSDMLKSCFRSGLVLLVAVALSTGSTATNAGVVIFSDSFESGLGLWKGPSGGTTSALIVADPLGSNGNVVTFTGQSWLGDLFTLSPLLVGGYDSVVVSFDYLGTPVAGSTPGDYGGFVGFTTDYNHVAGNGAWIAGTDPSAANGLGFTGIELVDDGAWHSYSVDISSVIQVNGISAITLMLEDWGDAGGNQRGVSGDVFFDNISLTVSPVPEIDPAGMGSVLALVGGSLGVLERRRRRKA